MKIPSEKTMSPLIMKTCEMFAKNGIEVELWVPWRNNRTFSRLDPFLHHDVQKNFSIRRFPAIDFTGLIPGNLIFYLLLFTFNLALFVRIIFGRLPRSTVFYFHDIRDAVLPSFLKMPMYVEIHDFYKSSVRWINVQCFPRMRGFVVTNTMKMDLLEKEFHIPRGRMLHQPNAVDLSRFSLEISREEARRILNLPLEERIILYAGHLFDWKGVDTLFDVHAFLARDEKIYFVGGTDEDIKKFKAKSSKLKVANMVIVGRRPHGEIPLWLRAADVLVLPSSAKFDASKYETSPVKLFEYMASGRPIVASDLPSIRNIVDERMAFFAAADSPRFFAEAIHAVLSHPDEAEMRGRAARDGVRPYSWELRTAHIISFLHLLGS